MIFEVKIFCIQFLLLVEFGHLTSVQSSRQGTVFSPLVRKADVFNTQAYTVEMIKVMLNVIVDGGFNAIATYGVGAPNKPYSDNTTYIECSSFVHTARAAAELNRERNLLALTLYQGAYNSIYEDQVNCEIEVSLKTAQWANVIYNGSVPAIIYPSTVQYNEMIDNENLKNRMYKVSKRVRLDLNIKYGVRVMDCQNIPTKTWDTVKDIMDKLDFIICSIAPDESKFKFGYSKFKEYAELLITQAEGYLVDKVNHSIKIILETGWPGDSSLSSPNSVDDEQHFWNEIEEWGNAANRTVFLSEAFDSPWKAEHAEWPLAAYFGHWKYNDMEPDLLFRQAYVLKSDIVPSILRKILALGPTLAGIFGGVLALTLVAILMLLLFKRVLRIEKATALLSEYEVNIFLNGLTLDEAGTDFHGDEWEKSPYNKNLELNKNQLKIDKSQEGLLGKGQFGCVYRAHYLSNDGEISVDVAVKMTKSNCSSQTEIKSLLTEIKILTYVGFHENVCGIVGAYTEELSKGIVYLATEYCAMGNLEQYLRQNQENFHVDSKEENGNNVYVSSKHGPEAILLSEHQLLQWSHEVAVAMQYISSKNVIHSDLATRNILLTSVYTTKITDFGLSRLLEEDDLYSKRGSEPLPWKWLAPECLELRQFSTKSDVWSYGITVWEIFSVGGAPKYDGVKSWNDLLQALKDGKRMEKPEFANDPIYAILLQCWKLEPSCRPSFEALVASLVTILNGQYTDLSEA